MHMFVPKYKSGEYHKFGSSSSFDGGDNAKLVEQIWEYLGFCVTAWLVLRVAGMNPQSYH